MKALLGIALATAVIYLTLKAARDRTRAVPTLQPVKESGPQRPEPLRDADLKVEHSVPF
jgi:hypothetical protein